METHHLTLEDLPNVRYHTQHQMALVVPGEEEVVNILRQKETVRPKLHPDGMHVARMCRELRI
jgi:hypothetical protein